MALVEWKEQDGVRWLEAELPGARAAFTTRIEGLSEAPYDSLNVAVKTGDEPGRVHDNRRALAAALGIAPENVVMGRQVHGADLHWHEGPQAPRVYADVLVSPIEVDGHLTDQPGLVPFVMTADCLPIVLAGSGGVASVHGGWRGLAAGIAGRAAERIGASAAAIGPGIGPCCYEVGDEVRTAFRTRTGDVTARAWSTRGARHQVDLRTAVAALLAAAGVSDVEVFGPCTACGPGYHSYRRDGTRTGRQLSFIGWA
jgi:hypothetical protein